MHAPALLRRALDAATDVQTLRDVSKPFDGIARAVPFEKVSRVLAELDRAAEAHTAPDEPAGWGIALSTAAAAAAVAWWIAARPAPAGRPDEQPAV